jgi:hypothetical protein
VPFPVLLDEEGVAAGIVGTGALGPTSLLRPGQIVAGFRSLAGGNIQHKAGRRPMQLGATIVMGPGDEIIYEDFEDYAGDHADIDEVIASLV